MLFFGFFLELYYGKGSLDGEFVKCYSGRTCSAEHDSTVPSEIVAICWFVTTIAMYGLDRMRLQRR